MTKGRSWTGTRMHTAAENPEPTGRIKFGTESNGGFKAITITNCVFECCRGLALETVDGALAPGHHRLESGHADNFRCTHFP